ncbi:cyclin-B3-1 [Pyrus ussuriensis x Pyrus communis]|uniref:Cyclin-F n=1 Tax=Pyrus ussuriensis x Pyrus communis TaxID=2448454 RepID=A0A5N5FKZ9_9ROSA|nr:cyclin-B3-1 [Pyrus ussuriensis x Pyrus communis]
MAHGYHLRSRRRRRRLDPKPEEPKLPFEIIIEILSWLPVEALLRFKCVSKTWCSLIEEYNFILKHMKRVSPIHLQFRLKSERNHVAPYFDSNYEGMGRVAGMFLEKHITTHLCRIRNPATRRVLNLPEAHKGFQIMTVGKDEKWRPWKHPNQGLLKEQGRRIVRCNFFAAEKMNGRVCYSAEFMKRDGQDLSILEVQRLDLVDESVLTATLPQGVFPDLNKVCVINWNKHVAVVEIVNATLHALVCEDSKENKWSPKKIVVPLKFMEKIFPPLQEGRDVIIPVNVDGDDFSFYCFQGEQSFVYNTKMQKAKYLYSGVDRWTAHRPSLMGFKGMRLEEEATTSAAKIEDFYCFKEENSYVYNTKTQKPKSFCLIGLKGMNLEEGATTVGVASFKVYTESDTAKADAGSRTYAAVNKVSTQENTAALKAGLKSMEKRKGILGNSAANANVGRRALADVSNVKSNSSRIVGGDGSKKMTGKSERIKSLQRVSVGTGVRTVNLSSRRSFLGKGQESPGQATSKLQTSKRGSKDLKALSENQGTKAIGLNRESVVTDGRSTSYTSLKVIRKSLPVLKVNPEQASIPKDNAGTSENSERKSECNVKVKVGKKVASRVNTNARSHPLRNRVSDGFVIMGQRNSNARVLPRNSVRPTLSTLKAHESQRTLKSKGASGPNKLVSAAATSSKTEKVVMAFLPDNVKHEATQVELPSEQNSRQSASTIISRRKSNRRRSYTSLLMTGSKLLEERVEAMKEEELPSIDDDCNQLEVSDYVDEIYQYYWVSEAQNPPPENLLSIQADITPHMRGILVNWLIEVHHKFELMQETLYLMVTLLDQYLSQVTIKKDDMQLVGLTALLLASKYEDFWHPRVKDLISISAETYTRAQVLGMEKAFLKKLKFRLNAPTPYVFMLRFLKAAQSETKLEHLAFYLIELCLVEYEALRFKPSLLCAAALYVARCTLQITPAWTPLLCKHARYEVSQIRDCAELILRFHKAARVGRLKVTYEKYSSPDLSGVAAIKPLDSLPL